MEFAFVAARTHARTLAGVSADFFHDAKQ
jgi:hypothetical protein